MENEKRKLPVALTADELNSKRDDLAKANLDLAAIKQEKSSQASTFNARIKETTTIIAELAQAISSRQEYREVEVEERRDEENFLIKVVRLDNEEIVTSRAMSSEERQLRLPTIGSSRARRAGTPRE